MSALDGTITFTTSEYRPCFVKNQRALFHRWEENSEIYAPSLMVGGHNGSIVKYTCAIVEYEDGHVERVKPEAVTFVDHLIKEYAFPESEDKIDVPFERFEESQRGIARTETKIQCPFCGGENQNAVVFYDAHGPEYFVYCRKCKIETTESYKTKAAAIKAFILGKTKKITGGGKIRRWQYER